MEKGYKGKISNCGTQVVEAPITAGAGRGKSSVKKGGDLRTGTGRK